MVALVSIRYSRSIEIRTRTIRYALHARIRSFHHARSLLFTSNRFSGPFIPIISPFSESARKDVEYSTGNVAQMMVRNDAFMLDTAASRERESSRMMRTLERVGGQRYDGRNKYARVVMMYANFGGPWPHLHKCGETCRGHGHAWVHAQRVAFWNVVRSIITCNRCSRAVHVAAVSVIHMVAFEREREWEREQRNEKRICIYAVRTCSCPPHHRLPPWALRFIFLVPLDRSILILFTFDIW